MPYNTKDSLPRADISTLLMEAVDVEKNFVGQLVLPIYPTQLSTGRYPRFKKGEGGLLNREATERNATGTYNEIERKFSWEEFSVKEKGLEERVDDVVAAQMQSYFDAEMVTAKLLMRSLMLDFEVEVATAIMNTSNFTATNSAVAYTEANLATVDFARDIEGAVERLTLRGESPNTIIMSLSVWNRLKRSTLLQKYLWGPLNSSLGASSITPEMVAAQFGVQQIIITKQSYNMAAKNKPVSLGPVWGNSYVFVGNIQSGDFMNGGIGRTIIWDADSQGGLFTSESYRAENRRGDILRVRSHRDIKIVNADAGELITTQWA